MYTQAGPQPGAEQTMNESAKNSNTTSSSDEPDIQDADFEEVK
jgi:hypothetical protein